MEKELPKSWVETKIGELSQIIRGVSYSKSDSRQIKQDGDFLILRGGNIQDGYIVDKLNDEVYVSSSIVKDIQKIKKGDVVIVGSTGSSNLIGKAGIAKSDLHEITFGAFLMLIRCRDEVVKEYFDYFFISDFYRSTIRELAGGVNINNIRKEYIENLVFPLPPKPEQERIVAKLDVLFGELEKVKTRLANIPTLLKNFRQAVLTQAVTGKLTQEWRLPAGKAGVGKELGEWQETKLDDLILFAGNGLSKRRGTEGEEITVLRLADFKKSVRTYGEERSVVLNKKEQEKYVLDIDDLLIVRVNGSVDLAGKFILYSERDKQEAYCDHFIRVKVDPQKIGSLYLTYITNSGEGRQYLQNSLSTSAGQNTINQKSVRGLTVNLPSLEEQQEIVRSLVCSGRCDRRALCYPQTKNRTTTPSHPRQSLQR